MNLAILIPTYDRPKQLAQVLQSLTFIKHKYNLNMFNVYVRDNSSGSIALDNEKLTLKHGFNYQVNSSNMGYAYSINNLINDSVEDAILFMSDDDQIIEDGFIRMLDFVQSNLSSSPILLPYVKTSLEKSEFKLNPNNTFRYQSFRNFKALSYISSVIYPRCVIDQRVFTVSNSFQHLVPIVFVPNQSHFRVLPFPVIKINSRATPRWNTSVLLADVFSIANQYLKLRKINFVQYVLMLLSLFAWMAFIKMKYLIYAFRRLIDPVSARF